MNFQTVPTPCYIVDEAGLQCNLDTLALVKERTGCRILLALKGFAMWSLFPIIKKVLDGVCASSPWEARLGREEFGGEVHVFAAAYSDADFAELLTLCDEIDFNSFAQFKKFRPLQKNIRFGLRINPECSTQDHAIYDPCAPKSRLGITRDQFEGESLSGISGLHFHTLCEQNADALETTLTAVEEKFGEFIPQMEWVNFGGGHHITRSDYDIDLLCRLINNFKAKYGVQVILEPGEAVALNIGVLVTTVLDIIENDGPIAILDCSCTCHMPDVMEMPYRPNIIGGAPAGEKKYTYRLAGLSCLAGDVIGDYSFSHSLQPGDRLVFEDMAHYTMVKTTLFNGIRHPSIAIQRGDDVDLVREFHYEDYKNRLS
ncbi:MAG: carboxynorspermidine decarboxylase [Verrucomicrobiota bacterium]|jgi:carboxynorspermidine decarboxylase|nr:carboxynorspermidine decarboxylase [Verrucomicrobiota bacterium]MDK2963144.1 carboxynorspermidine decarboxylase [Verrucomicrobiota bacterium]